MFKKRLKFNAVRNEDKVAVFVPSSPVKEPYRTNGLKRIKKMGFVPVECENILSSEGFVAKKPVDTLDDLKKFIEDEEIRIIWAARGGYGSIHLLPFLNEFKKKIKTSSPKIIIGSSDVSYLLWSLLDIPEFTVLYGPMAYSSFSEGKFNESQLIDLLFSSEKKLKIKADILIEGKCEGIFTGGCMSNLVSLIGTPFFPELKNRVLLLEDLNERPYKLDRMLWQLKNSGIFSSVSAIVLGEFPGCFIDENEKNDFYSSLRKYLIPYKIPVLINLPLGHSENIQTVPLGVNVQIDTSAFSGISF